MMPATTTGAGGLPQPSGDLEGAFRDATSNGAHPSPDGDRAPGHRRRPPAGLAGLVLLLGGLVIAPQLVSPFWVFVLAGALVYALAALSVNVLYGQAGMIALFPAAFLGIGAFAGAIITREGQGWVVALIGAAVISFVLGAAAGLPGTRLRGMAFGIVTFAFALAMDTVVFRHGILGIDPAFGATMTRPELAGLSFADDLNYYYLVLVVAVLTWLVVKGHEASRVGRAWRAIRDNELAGLAVGVPVSLYRVWAAALAGAVGGVAGVLFVTLQSQANAESFTPTQSLLIFTAAMTAGTRNVAGAVLAGALIIVLPQVLTDLGVEPAIVPLLFAVGVLVSLRGANGIVGGIQHAWGELALVVRSRLHGTA
jgi:branched-chain amino acid transport system permease protein